MRKTAAVKVIKSWQFAAVVMSSVTVLGTVHGQAFWGKPTDISEGVWRAFWMLAAIGEWNLARRWARDL